MVRQFQDLYFEGRRQSTQIGNPDLCSIAGAYGLKTYSINSEDDVNRVIDQCLQTMDPVLVNVKISKDSAVNPKLLVNKPIEDMNPLLGREELRKLMLIEMIDD
jgi:acetolactate synthase-1/2/3 large subunit